jgi:ABC-type glycerol-3-phosphate transport system substrate-binding protein
MKQKLIKYTIILVLVGVILFYFFGTDRQSMIASYVQDLEEYSYQEAKQTLMDSMDNPRYTYMDFLDDATVISTDFSFETTLNEGVTGLVSDYDSDMVDLGEHLEASYSVFISRAGYYELHLDYFVPENVLSDITVEVLINGDAQYDDASTINLPLKWADETKDFDIDLYGDQSLPRQVRVVEMMSSALYGNTYLSATPYVFYFESGNTTITLNNISKDALYVGDLTVQSPQNIPSYETYISALETTSTDAHEFYNAIDYVSKNTSFVRLMSYQNAALLPYNPTTKMLNVIDGQAWSEAGQEVTFEFEVPSNGLYTLTFDYMNDKSDYSTFRSIVIDDQILFDELLAYEFPFTNSQYENHTLGGVNPYQFYFEAGTHTMTLRAETDPVSESVRDLQLLIDHINEFALDIIRITGKDIDENRTWKLTNYIPETETYLRAYQTILKQALIDLSQHSSLKDNSTQLSYLRSALDEMDLLLEDPDELPLYLDNLYTGETSVVLYLGESMFNFQYQPLYLDGFYVSTDDAFVKANSGFFTNAWNSLLSFVDSFIDDKTDIANEEDVIDVWVNRPLTYADTMQKLADSTFTPETGLQVKISVMPDPNKLILANSAGNTPDVALGLMSYMPFDLAIRGAVVDLSEFDDFWEYSNKFQAGALVPYILEDGVYAMPETLDFNALVYRTDVFETLELEVPDTWDDVINLLPNLQRYDMNMYYPTSGGTSLKWFYQTSPLIYQYDGTLYSEDGLTTNINSEESIEGLQLLGDLYTTYSLPEQVPLFFNSFRYNRLPIGIIDFNTYMQLKFAAPELVGQWELAPYPGTVDEETGEVVRWYIGNGTGGVIFEASDDVEGSWEFMKWWMSTQTQTQFAYDIQATYGPEFLWLSGNLEAIQASPIDYDDKQVILEQITWLRDVPRTPGQYMLERGLSDIWNQVTFESESVRVAVDEQIIIINREIEKKMIEFGYLDVDGNILKAYTIRDVDWIQAQMDAAVGGEDNE